MDKYRIKLYYPFWRVQEKVGWFRWKTLKLHHKSIDAMEHLNSLLTKG